MDKIFCIRIQIKRLSMMNLFSIIVIIFFINNFFKYIHDSEAEEMAIKNFPIRVVSSEAQNIKDATKTILEELAENGNNATTKSSTTKLTLPSTLTTKTTTMTTTTELSTRIPIMNHSLDGPVVKPHPFNFTINQFNACFQQKYTVLKVLQYPANSSWWNYHPVFVDKTHKATTTNKILKVNISYSPNDIKVNSKQQLNDSKSHHSKKLSLTKTLSYDATLANITTITSTPTTLTTTTTNNLYAVVYIHTSPTNYKNRKMIREMWGNSSYHIHSIKILFFIGLPKPDTIVNNSINVQKAIDLESSVYNDIIQENYIDDYHNLTYKGVGALKWVAEYCSHVKYIIKTDDDILVNIFMLFNYLDSQMLSTNTIFCCVWDGVEVLREGKWKVDPKDYPDIMYPKYCSGSAFVMTTDLAQKLYAVSHYVPFFWVDDVYVTGFLPKKLSNVTHVQLYSFYTFVDSEVTQDDVIGMKMFMHISDEITMRKLWKKIVWTEIGLNI